jgi:hypothetical protein
MGLNHLGQNVETKSGIRTTSPTTQNLASANCAQALPAFDIGDGRGRESLAPIISPLRKTLPPKTPDPLALPANNATIPYERCENRATDGYNASDAIWQGATMQNVDALINLIREGRNDDARHAHYFRLIPCTPARTDHCGASPFGQAIVTRCSFRTLSNWVRINDSASDWWLPPLAWAADAVADAVDLLLQHALCQSKCRRNDGAACRRDGSSRAAAT